MPKEILIGTWGRRASPPAVFLWKKFFMEVMSGGRTADGEIGRHYLETSSKTAFACSCLYLRRPPRRRTSEETCSPADQRCMTYLRGSAALHYTPISINQLRRQITEVIFCFCVTSKSVVPFARPLTVPFTPSSASLVLSVFKFIHASTGPLSSSCPAQLPNASSGWLPL